MNHEAFFILYTFIVKGKIHQLSSTLKNYSSRFYDIPCNIYIDFLPSDSKNTTATAEVLEVQNVNLNQIYF